MALQGKITAKRSIQAGGLKTKAIVARNMTISDGQSLSALTDVDVPVSYIIIEPSALADTSTSDSDAKDCASLIDIFLATIALVFKPPA
jgi:hypothetical protein